jgi:hypothetical protein
LCWTNDSFYMVNNIIRSKSPWNYNLSYFLPEVWLIVRLLLSSTCLVFIHSRTHICHHPVLFLFEMLACRASRSISLVQNWRAACMARECFSVTAVAAKYCFP